MAVPTKRTIPMIASHRSPLIAKPTIARMSQTTSKTTRSAIMRSVYVRRVRIPGSSSGGRIRCSKRDGVLLLADLLVAHHAGAWPHRDASLDRFCAATSITPSSVPGQGRRSQQAIRRARYSRKVQQRCRCSPRPWLCADVLPGVPHGFSTALLALCKQMAARSSRSRSSPCGTD
jgi:hypothetical protein